MNLNDLQYYPRFVFNCSDGKCFSTDDLALLKDINIPHINKIDQFRTGEEISIKWSDIDEPKQYIILKIDIRDIRYDSDEKLYGFHEDDCSAISTDKDKFHLMSIFIFLEAVEEA
jgi:hypothetical protein